MEFVILGLLMLKPMTGYEISRFIKSYLSMICSNSAGSMQAALKKLLDCSSVGFDEFVENSKNKKVFYITEIGKKEFADWLQTPMQTEKRKNMELSKLFFLGFAPKESRLEAISGYIKQLKAMKTTMSYIKNEYDKLKEDGGDMLRYQGYTLEYGIASAEFEINWYTNLLNKMEDDL